MNASIHSIGGRATAGRACAERPGRYLALVAALFALAIVAHLVVAVAQVGVPTAATESTAIYDAAQRRIASEFAGPKIAYVSGSSGFYSVRAGEIAGVVGRECVNLGLHAGLGASYLLNRAAAVMQRGDTCVLGLEYELYAEERPGEFYCDYVMARDRAYFTGLSWWEQTGIIVAAGPGRIWAAGVSGVWPQEYATGAAVLTNLSSLGDRLNTSPADRPYPSRLAICPVFESSLFERVTPRSAMAIDSFLAACRAKGIRVLVTYPPLCITGVPDPAVERRLADRFLAFWADRNTSVIGTPGDSLYSASESFDTPYHLLEAAAYRHSHRLGEHLRHAGIDATAVGPLNSCRVYRAAQHSSQPRREAADRNHYLPLSLGNGNAEAWAGNKPSGSVQASE